MRFCGTAEAVPFQSMSNPTFSASCEAVPFQSMSNPTFSASCEAAPWQTQRLKPCPFKHNG
jgi:hypothetical protein